MPTQLHGKLALESFHHCFLVPVFLDWDRRNDLSFPELQIVDARIVEACCWMLLGMDLGYFDECLTLKVLKEIGSTFTKSIETSLQTSGHMFDRILIPRVQTLASLRTATRQPIVANSTLLRFGTLTALGGAFMQDQAARTFLAALLYLKSGWEYLSKPEHCTGRAILQPQDADFDPWTSGRIGLVYNGLLNAIHHVEESMVSLSSDLETEGESASEWATIRTEALSIHLWWFNLENEQITKRFKLLAENFGSVSSHELSIPNNDLSQAFPQYVENLMERWRKFTKPQVASSTA